MTGILEGTGPVIDRFFGVEQFGSTTPHYKHKQSCLHISEQPLPALDSLALLEELYRIIEANWQRSRSCPHGTRSPWGLYCLGSHHRPSMRTIHPINLSRYRYRNPTQTQLDTSGQGVHVLQPKYR